MDFNKLWQNFLDTVQNHYIDFDGRVGRPQFWYFVAVNIVISIVIGIVAGIIHLPGLSSLYGLVMLAPSLGMTARRFHDVGKPTTWVLILAIPLALELVLGFLALLSIFFLPLLLLFAGLAYLVSLLALVAGIVVIYFCAQPGDAGPNAYGPVPPVFSPN
jgi:uncharacterized membrane protein YhaH (DUF805 family)